MRRRHTLTRGPREICPGPAATTSTARAAARAETKSPDDQMSFSHLGNEIRVADFRMLQTALRNRNCMAHLARNGRLTADRRLAIHSARIEQQPLHPKYNHGQGYQPAPQIPARGRNRF